MDKNLSKFKTIPGMINVGFWSFYESLCHNNQFFTASHLGARGNTLEKFNDLYKMGRIRNVNFIGLDLLDGFGEIDCFLFSDFPRMENRLVKDAFASGKPMFLLLIESEAICPKNWDISNHRFFEKIFTWHDDFVDNKKYFKANIDFIETRRINKDLSRKKKLCTLIASNKSVVHPLELYSKRRGAIRWFEKNHPEDFDLYGNGWDSYSFPITHSKVLPKLGGDRLKSLIKKLLAPNHPSWKGVVKSKGEVLEKYKFAICYENTRDIPGYISEKIFDSFSAGTVPVYWGADNVTDHVPKECFIDKRDFEDYESLYKFMKGVTKKQYLDYLYSIEDFLNSKKSNEFTIECFADTVIGEIEKTLEETRYGQFASHF